MPGAPYIGSSSTTEPLPPHPLQPYVPRLVADWLIRTPAETHRAVDGTMLFADISGFTRLTERLSRLGKVGAEEMSDALDGTFGHLLAVAAADGADLIKWGGDAVLLLFQGERHAERACRAGYRMRGRLRQVGDLVTSAGHARLRMSIGVHTGRFHFFLVGDPAVHRELVVCGHQVSVLVGLEAAASAGEIGVSPSTGARLGAGLTGAPLSDVGRLLRREPDLPDLPLPEPPGVPADLETALPVAIRRHLLQGRGEAEHRDIGVAFVAFSGTDRLLRQQGARAVRDGLDAVVRNVADAVDELQVTFFESDINRDGGKIMLTAGAPTSAGHDAERLLRAARLIVERAGVLPLRVGVNVGHVFSGDFGPPFRRTYSVKGDAINLAARLVARAEPGQVLATSVVPDRSQTRFVLRLLPAFTVKGKNRPVHAVDVGPMEVRTNGTHRAATALVGRTEEIAVLGDALDAARARRGTVVQLVGEAGIGKSRLLGEVAAMAAGMTVLSLVCDEYEASTPYYAVRLLLRDLLGIGPRIDPALVEQRLDARLRDNAPELLPWLPLLGTPLDLSLEDTEATRSLSDEFRKRRLEEVVGDFLHLLLPTPTLLLVDDAQFLDGASGDLLDHLAARVAGEPWLVVIGRREQPHGWPGPGIPVPTLQLKPLSSAESIRLLQGSSGSRPLPRPTVATLAARAGGNPLFLESLIHAAAEGGRVDDLPESVQDLVTTQVDRLSPADRIVLRYAAVLGTRFDTDDLSMILAGHAERPDGRTFDRLADFVVPERGTLLRFRHGLMRDVVYEGLPYRTRQRLHDRVGEALEAADAEGSFELLSLHFFQARRFDKAWRYSRQAARGAHEKFANQEAVDLLRRAVEAERHAPRGLVSPAELCGVLEELGDTWFTIGLPEQAADAYRRARRQLAGDPVQEARIVAKEARIDQRLRRLPQSLRRVTRALRQLEQVQGRWASSARSLLEMRYAISRFSQGRIDEALMWGQRACVDAEESVDKATLAQAYATMHGIYVAAVLESPMPYGELALQAYTELEDLPHQADCTNNLAVSALDHNRWVEAAETFRRAAAIYRRIGDTQGEGIAIYNQADVLLRQGRLGEADQLLGEALMTARSVSDEELVALVLRETGRVRCRAGDLESGRALLDRARALFSAIDEPEELPATDLAICEALLLTGDPVGALAGIDSLADPEQTLGPVVHRLRGSALLDLGRAVEAETELRAGVTAAVDQDNLYERALNLLGLARATGDTAVAAEAAMVLDSLGVVTVPVGTATLEGATIEGATIEGEASLTGT